MHEYNSLYSQNPPDLRKCVYLLILVPCSVVDLRCQLI